MNPYASTSVTARPERSYLATRVLTAPPQVLVLMLYDGALRETVRARSVDPAQPGAREQLHKALTRAQDFIRELLLALDREKGGELAERLAALYLFCQERLIQANVKADPALCEDVLRVLRPLRDAWAQICGVGAGEAATGSSGTPGEHGPVAAGAHQGEQEPAGSSAVAPGGAMPSKRVPGALMPGVPAAGTVAAGRLAAGGLGPDGPVPGAAATVKRLPGGCMPYGPSAGGH